MKLDELPSLDAADVFIGATRVAQLTTDGTFTRFRYLPETPDSLAVATTLPVGNEQPVTTPGRAVPPYFAGLLPEGRRLSALRTAIKTSADDDLSLLVAAGDAPVGRVRVAAAGTGLPPVSPPPPQVGSLEQLDFADVLERSLGADGLDRVALAGVQDKVSGAMITVPLSVAGTDHLLKLDPPEFPHLVRNEAFFLTMARACGLATVDARVIIDRHGRPGLLVTRFDRIGDRHAPTALAVEDGCQVSNRYPSDKYSMSAETVLTNLAEHCRARAAALLQGFEQVLFAVITGNGDQHAKNFSMMHTGSEWRLAPAYDIPSSQPYGDSSLAINLGGTRDPQVSRRRALTFADDIGLPTGAARLALDRLLERTTPWTERLDELPFDDARIHKLRRVMLARIRLLST
ncbi:MAG TPA: HipA domain-containing protein [Ilumatobacter sp.]|nr:HipA domain-containing protein [Ilumatobacter sp.]